MFRIRKITDPNSGSNAEAVRNVIALLKSQFSAVPAEEFERLPDKLTDPLKSRLRAELFVAEDAQDRLRGAAAVLHAPDLQFLFLDFMAVPPGRSGGGVGGALYQRVREEAVRLDTVGIFLECLPDDPSLCRRPELLAQNVQRLRFYERFGARPIIGTLYEAPVSPKDDCPPYLVYDDCGSDRPLRRATAREIVRAIYARKYPKFGPPSAVEKIIASIADDPVHLRPYRYVRRRTVETVRASHPTAEVIPLVVNEGHEIHHVRERGYVQAPVRLAAILRELPSAAPFARVPAGEYDERHMRAVHDGDYVGYLKRACAQVPQGTSVYPYIFPIRNTKRPPRELPLRAGYFCIDTFTPLNANAWLAARGAVNCTLTAADAVLAGARFAYALVRPPGHHAESRAFGGFCYFNNAAIAAHYLSRYGKVAVLDIDYHHGNGTQEIFWRRKDVLTISLHGHPSFAYPYFSGFREERGEGDGRGYNINFPLPESLTPAKYLETLDAALKRVARYRPDFLVVPLGYDTAVADPTGSWSNRPKDFEAIGRRIAALALPTVIVQEGGYRTRTLGANAAGFFAGLWAARATLR
jgi:acetoin utilization deacetylase AcuC-like enzyme